MLTGLGKRLVEATPDLADEILANQKKESKLTSLLLVEKSVLRGL